VGWLIEDSFPFAKAGRQSDPNATMSRKTDREHCSEPNDLNFFISVLFPLELHAVDVGYGCGNPNISQD
jgi:hypothetical protein